MFLILLFVFIIAFIIFSIITYGRSNYGLLENNGYPVLSPSLFLGSLPNIHKEIAHYEDIKRYKKFGPIWAVYEGKAPQVFICDPELIRLVFVKDFEYFHDRRDFDFGNPVFNEILDYLPGEKWKVTRSKLSPLFTSAKLKNMSRIIEKVSKEFSTQLIDESNEFNGRLKIDTRNRLVGFLIDMFAQTTIGVELEDAKNPNNKFALAFRQMMGEGTDNGLLYSLSLTFPYLAQFVPTFLNEPTELIKETFRNVLQTRRKTGEKRSNDFVDILNDLWAQVSSEEFSRLGITEITILAQAMNFFLGGFETSSSTSTYFLYQLASNPQIQMRLYNEIKEVFDKNDGSIENRDSIKDEELPYLVACINETLRLAPPIIRPERQCMKDWTYNGITIKKGSTVFIPGWAAGRNPEIYENPEKFDPDKFLPENKASIDPYAFTSFGFGPRNCIGMRFAYESLKYIFCHLLKNFEVKVRPDTELKFKPGQLLVVAYEPLYLDLVQRK